MPTFNDTITLYDSCAKEYMEHYKLTDLEASQEHEVRMLLILHTHLEGQLIQQDTLKEARELNRLLTCIATILEQQANPLHAVTVQSY